MSDCPWCGGEMSIRRHAGDALAPECWIDYCLDCGFETEAE